MPTADEPLRPGERTLPYDPAGRDDARLCFIGQVRSPWTLADCPKNPAEARKRGGRFGLTIAPEFREGLTGLAEGTAVIVLTYLHAARRDLILQSPRHRNGLTGTFALRSPARPNPLGLTIARITSLDMAAGEIGLDVIDAIDGTPVIDLKPWIGAIDIPPAE